jgi:hypothetical protein
MDEELVELLTQIAEAGRITEGDVMALRDLVWTEEALDVSVIEALFALNDDLNEYSPIWTDFFIEAVEYYLLDQCMPQGFLDEDRAYWLHERIDKNGLVGSRTEIELLISVLEHAESVPDNLRCYALEQIEAIIVSGQGPTRNGQDCVPNRVDEAEVELLRRAIFAGGGEGAVVVGNEEADMLFRIKDATLASENAPGWMALFVQGVGNHLMAHSDYRPLSNEDAVRLNQFMDDYTPSLGGFFRRTLPREMIGTGTIVDAFKSLFPKQEDRFAKKLALDHRDLVTAEEAVWLKTQIAADGQTDDYEKALLTFVVDESRDAPSILETMRKRA